MNRALLGISVLGLSLSVATGLRAQSLEEELSYLLATHPTIETARSEVVAAEEDVNIAFSGFLPDVTVFGDAGYERTDEPNAGTSENPLDTDREVAGVIVTENLFDGFRTHGSLDAAKLNQGIAELALDATIQDILLDGVIAYHELLRQTRIVELAAGNEERIKTVLELEDARVRRGGGITVDVLFAKSRLQIAVEQRVTFEGALRNARIRYAQVFGRPADIDKMTDPVPPLDLLPQSIEDATAIALSNNPEVIASSQQVDVADEQRVIARSDYYPSIDLVGAANVENNVDGIKGKRQELSAGVEFSWDIFSGFETNARVARAAAEYSGAISTLSDTKRDIAEEARIAFNDLVTAREREVLLRMRSRFQEKFLKRESVFARPAKTQPSPPRFRDATQQHLDRSDHRQL